MNVQILGTRGIPARHGGFESFAEEFALYLVRKKWQVTVYCQEQGTGPVHEDQWRDIHLVHVPVRQTGAPGTIVFDWKSTLLAARRKTPVLTLGYNTALFCLLYRLRGVTNIINMDGIEWQRPKWNFPERCWLYINEKLGAFLGNHLVADHPEIKNHLAGFVRPDKITVIPYGAEIIRNADSRELRRFNLKPGSYCILVARPEPENSILEIVQAYSRKTRGIPLVILGEYHPDLHEYHRRVLDAAGNEVLFPGAIYNRATVQALRFHARLYIHGHTVGGTNPSLVEAMGAGSPVLAHDNRFNRWVAGQGARYFSSQEACEEELTALLQDDDLIRAMRESSYQRINERFGRDRIHRAYEEIILSML